MYLFYMRYTQKNDLCPSQIYDEPSCDSFLWVHFKSSQIRIYQIIKPTWEWFYYVYLILPILDPKLIIPLYKASLSNPDKHYIPL